MDGPGHGSGAWSDAPPSVCRHCGNSVHVSVTSCPRCGQPQADVDALTVLGDALTPTPAGAGGTSGGPATDVTRFVAPLDSPDDVTRVVAPAEAPEDVTRFAATTGEGSDDVTRFAAPEGNAADDVTRFAAPDDAHAASDSSAEAMTVAGPVTPTAHKARVARRGSKSDGGPLEVGQSFGTRYHIIRMLGVGGMGAVYQAWDAELGVAVAIKVIRPEVMEDPVMAEEVSRRFKRELLLARQVTHKNVVRIHDLGDIDGIKYITMSYVEGVELSTILKRDGKQPVRDVLRIARSVVSGLVAAHTAGVVHRDLKPANIMIGADGEALIMDFGIAHSTGDPAAPAAGAGLVPENLRRTASNTAATTLGSVIGTVEYMAPEQARGQAIDQRADVYAFGLILYDILLGRRRASSGQSAVDDLQRRMTAPPPPLQALDKEIPALVAALVGRCVEPEADKRFQTSAEVAAELDRLDDDGKLIPIARRLTKRMVVLTTLLVSVLVGGAVYVTQQAAKPEEQPEPVKLIIADIANPTRNVAFNGTLEPMIRLALEETGFISAYDRTQIRALGLPPIKGSLGPDAARQIAFQQGLGVVITGEIRTERAGFALDLRATESVTGKVIAETSQTFASADTVLATLTRATTELRNALGDDVSESSQRFAQETLSATSLEAVAEYARAMDALSNGAQPQARDAALRAVALDANFGSAYGVAAIAARNMGQPQEASKYLQSAIEHLGSMTQRERFRTRGFSYTLKGDHQKCAEEYGALIKQYYADASAHNNLAICLNQLRDRRALDEIRKASAILPKRALYHVNTALFSAYASDFPAANTAANTALELNPAFPQGIIARAFAQLGEGRLADAAATYETLDKVSPSDARTGLADIAIYEGRFNDAVRILNDGIAADVATKSVDRAADKLVALAYAEQTRGNWRAAIVAADRALMYSTSPKIRFLAGRLFSEAGDLPRARAQAKELAAGLDVTSQASAKIVEANVARADGNLQGAVTLLTEANTKLLDTWIGRFDLGRVYLAAKLFLEADGEFERCLNRKGEAMSLYLDEVPTFGYFPQVHYYVGRVRDGLKQATAADSYRAYLEIRGKAAEDPLLADVRRSLQK